MTFKFVQVKASMMSSSTTVLFFLCAVSVVIAKEIRVGGDQGWTMGVQYKDIHAAEGDVLVFEFARTFHDVWLVPDAACSLFNFNNGYNVANPQQSPAKYILKDTGTYHFACIIPGHCGAGMLVTVIVSDEVSSEEIDAADPAELSQELQDERDPGFCSEPWDNGDGSFTVNCRSAAVRMAPGDQVNANLRITIPVPPEDVILVDSRADLVDEMGRSVPLSEVYVHHIFAFYGQDLPVSEGAEFRGVPLISEVFPWPYARMVRGRTYHMATVRQYLNFHLINTLGLDDEEEVKRCIECWCPGTNPVIGQMSCCRNCNTTLFDEPPISYFYNYTVSYMPLSSNNSATNTVSSQSLFNTASGTVIDVNGHERKIVDSSLLDITGSKVEHNVHAAGPGKFASISRVYDFYSNCNSVKQFGFISCAAHQHIGGVCIRAYVDQTNELVCESCAQYGTEEDEAGNELGYVVGVNATTHNPPMMLDVGTKIRIESIYRADQDCLGVMSLLWVHTYADTSLCQALPMRA